MPRKKVNFAEEPQQDVTEMEQSGMEAPALLENPCRDTDGPGADPSAGLDEPGDGLSTPEDGPHLPGEDTPEVMEVDVSAPPAPPPVPRCGFVPACECRGKIPDFEACYT